MLQKRSGSKRWSGNATITDCRPTHGNTRKRHRTRQATSQLKWNNQLLWFEYEEMLYIDLSCNTEWIKGDRKPMLSKLEWLFPSKYLRTISQIAFHVTHFLENLWLFNVNSYRLVRANSNGYGKSVHMHKFVYILYFFFLMWQVPQTHGYGSCTICRIQLQRNKHISSIYIWKCSSSIRIWSQHHWKYLIYL